MLNEGNGHEDSSEWLGYVTRFCKLWLSDITHMGTHTMLNGFNKEQGSVSAGSRFQISALEKPIHKVTKYFIFFFILVTIMWIE